MLFIVNQILLVSTTKTCKENGVENIEIFR